MESLLIRLLEAGTQVVEHGRRDMLHRSVNQKSFGSPKNHADLTRGRWDVILHWVIFTVSVLLGIVAIWWTWHVLHPLSIRKQELRILAS